MRPGPSPDPGLDRGHSRRAAEQAAKRFSLADPLDPAITKEGLYATGRLRHPSRSSKSTDLQIVGNFQMVFDHKILFVPSQNPLVLTNLQSVFLF